MSRRERALHRRVDVQTLVGVLAAAALRCRRARRLPVARAADMTKTLRVAFSTAENGFDPQAPTTRIRST
jgi:hypothetical protein